MSDRLASSDAFRGARTLFAERRGGALVGIPLIFGFAPALLFGFMCLLAGGVAPPTLGAILLPTFVVVCVGIPVLLGLPWTSVSQVNAPVRRDELLVLPLGRLALPAAALVGSLLAIAAWLAAVLVGLALTVGLRPLVQGLLDPAARETVEMWLGGAVAAFAVGTSIGSIGASWALWAGAWALAPVMVLSAARSMGYGEDAQRTYAMLCAAGLSLYLLVLPWLLYSRPRHIWTSSRQPEVEGSWGLVLATAVGATIALGLLGVGWVLAVVLAVGGGLTWLARRGRPALRGESALRLAFLASIVPVVPLIGAGLAVDARGDVEDAGALVPVQVEISPDGRHIAFAVEPQLAHDGGLCPRTRRVVVFDLAGERAPVVLPARFAELRSSAWSSDGRFLAVEDHTIGRLRSEPTRPAWRPEAIVDPLDVVASKVGTALDEGWIVDTRTGEVDLVDGFELAPGWKAPADLVRCTSSLSGDHVLRDGAGRELVIPRSRGALHVVGYSSAGPLLALGAQTPAVIDPTFGPVAARLHRWDAAAGLVAHDPARGARWAQELQTIDEAGVSRLRLTRDGGDLVLDPDVTRVLLEVCDLDGIVAIVGETTLVRIDARDGSRTVIVPAEGDAPLVVRDVDPVSGLALVVRRDAPLLVDLKTARCTPLPGEALGAIALVGERALATPQGSWPVLAWPVLVGADGAIRPVRPWAAE